MHAGDRGVGEQALGDHLRGRLLCTYAQRQGAQPAVQQVGGHRMQQSAGERAHLAQPLDPFAVGGDDAAHDVPVAAEVLGGAVQHEGRAVLDRALQHRGRERVVDEHRHVARGIRDLRAGRRARVSGSRASRRRRVPCRAGCAAGCPRHPSMSPRCRAVRSRARGRCRRRAGARRRRGAAGGGRRDERRGERRHAAARTRRHPRCPRGRRATPRTGRLPAATVAGTRPTGPRRGRGRSRAPRRRGRPSRRSRAGWWSRSR